MPGARTGGPAIAIRGMPARSCHDGCTTASREMLSDQRVADAGRAEECGRAHVKTCARADERGRPVVTITWHALDMCGAADRHAKDNVGLALNRLAVTEKVVDGGKYALLQE